MDGRERWGPGGQLTCLQACVGELGDCTAGVGGQRERGGVGWGGVGWGTLLTAGLPVCMTVGGVLAWVHLRHSWTRGGGGLGGGQGGGGGAITCRQSSLGKTGGALDYVHHRHSSTYEGWEGGQRSWGVGKRGGGGEGRGGSPVCRPVWVSQGGALAWVHHKHSSKACSVPSSKIRHPC